MISLTALIKIYFLSRAKVGLLDYNFHWKWESCGQMLPLYPCLHCAINTSLILSKNVQLFCQLKWLIVLIHDIWMKRLSLMLFIEITFSDNWLYAFTSLQIMIVFFICFIFLSLGVLHLVECCVLRWCFSLVFYSVKSYYLYLWYVLL